jgi:hypothetical protein
MSEIADNNTNAPLRGFLPTIRGNEQTDMIFIGLADYLLPIPSLIWAWVRWLKSEPRFVTPAWRSVLAFSGLILVSAIGLFVVLVFLYANSLPETCEIRVGGHVF